MLIQRDVLPKILPFLQTDDIILLYGARQVGKTSIMRIIQNNHISGIISAYLDLENEKILQALNTGQEAFIEYITLYHSYLKDKPFVCFIDEIQYLDNPTSFLKYLHDSYPQIKLIVSGSSTLEIRGKFKDSLAGRLLKFEIYPLSFREFLRFKGKEALLESHLELATEDLVRFYKEYMIFGGYPKVVLAMSAELKKIYLEQIYESYIQKDIKDIGHIRNIGAFNTLLKFLAHQIGNLLNKNEIANTLGISRSTIDEWLVLLKHTFVIDFLHPKANNVRSALIKMPKVFFLDNGIRNFILNTFESQDGALFEQSVFLEMLGRKKDLGFFRNKAGNEIDFTLPNIGLEVKLSYDGKLLKNCQYYATTTQSPVAVICLRKPEKALHPTYFPWELSEIE